MGRGEGPAREKEGEAPGGSRRLGSARPTPPRRALVRCPAGGRRGWDHRAGRGAAPGTRHSDTAAQRPSPAPSPPSGPPGPAVSRRFLLRAGSRPPPASPSSFRRRRADPAPRPGGFRVAQMPRGGAPLFPPGTEPASLTPRRRPRGGSRLASPPHPPGAVEPGPAFPAPLPWSLSLRWASPSPLQPPSGREARVRTREGKGSGAGPGGRALGRHSGGAGRCGPRGAAGGGRTAEGGGAARPLPRGRLRPYPHGSFCSVRAYCFLQPLPKTFILQ